MKSSESATNRRHNVLQNSRLNKHVCSYKQQRENDASVQVKVIKASEKEFLFGVKKPVILGMHQFRFLSEDPWETVSFAFILFFPVIVFFISF